MIILLPGKQYNFFLFYKTALLSSHHIVTCMFFSAEDKLGFVNNNSYSEEGSLTSCNCMDENCPNSGSNAVPYSKLTDEGECGSSFDAISTMTSNRSSSNLSSFQKPNLSVNSGDITMSRSYPPRWKNNLRDVQGKQRWDDYNLLGILLVYL